MTRLLLALFLATQPVLAFEIPPNDGFVTDTASVLTQAQDAELERLLEAYRQETSNEIAVLIVDSLEGDPLADTAFEVGRKWGVGTEQFNNGILLLVAYSDRELFLATGYGLEGAVPDIVAKGVIDTAILPQFREGDYYQGILNGIEALKGHIGGEYTAERYTEKSDSSGWIQFAFFIAFILFDLIAAYLARSKSWWLGGVIGGVLGVVLVLIFGWWLSIPLLALLGLLFDYVLSKNYKKNKRRGSSGWWWGGGGRGGSSGGFGGFSGGSFGGGGAGGSW